MEEYNQKLNWEITALLWQQALNLTGQSEDPLTLRGEAANETDLFRSGTENKNVMLVSLVYSFKMQLAYYFGATEMMEDLFLKTRNSTDHFMSLVYHPRQVFFDALVAFYLCQHTGHANARKRRQWLKEANKARHQIQAWAKAGNVNLTHAMVLLDAESDACRGRREGAKRKYELAISLSSRSGHQQDCALAHERAALNYLELRDAYWASHHMSSAHEKYLQWGARSKASQIMEAYGYLMKNE